MRPFPSEFCPSQHIHSISSDTPHLPKLYALPHDSNRNLSISSHGYYYSCCVVLDRRNQRVCHFFPLLFRPLVYVEASLASVIGLFIFKPMAFHPVADQDYTSCLPGHFTKSTGPPIQLRTRLLNLPPSAFNQIAIFNSTVLSTTTPMTFENSPAAQAQTMLL